MRPDLVLAAHEGARERHWVAHDPVTLQFFRLRAEEYAILKMLDGRATLDGIVERFERQFPPLRLGTRQLQGFLFRLHALGLIVGDAPGQGAVLRQRSERGARRSLLGTISNPLAIRLPGIAARPIIEWLYPRLRWMFSGWFVTLAAMLVVVAVGLAIVQFGAVQARLPDFWSFFSMRNAMWFAVALVITKALHELGHGLMCRHFGGECREFGLMLLVFMPTMYCDVSDAWKFENKWHRILVSAAGMLVELVLAAVAFLLWRFSEGGLLNAICLRVMFLCSVSTLLFNANPLLRCDGYYMLSDYLEAPNLWQESRSLWNRVVWRVLTGAEIPADPTIPRRLHGPLLAYAALSMVYLTLVVIGIFWFCVHVLEPYGLSGVMWVLAAAGVIGMLKQPARQAIQLLRAPRRHGVRRGRVWLSLLVTLGAVALLLVTPLPHRIPVAMWIEAEEARAVYAVRPGRLLDAIAPGAVVAENDELARLADPELAMQVERLAREVRVKESRLKNLRLMLNDDPSASPLIPAEEKALEDAKQQLAQRRVDQERLVLRAPRGGAVLPPPGQPRQLAEWRAKRLPSWEGTPLDAANRGAFLDMGTLVCLVGDSEKMEAMLVIEQASVPFVQTGQAVRIRVEQAPLAFIDGKITELAKADVENMPESLMRALDLPIQGSGGTKMRAAETYYQARVELASHDVPLLVGMHGHAKILADWQSLGTRFWRYVQRTFRFS